MDKLQTLIDAETWAMAMAARAIVDSGRDQSSWVERRVDDLVDDYDDVSEAVIRQWVESMLAAARPGKRS